MRRVPTIGSLVEEYLAAKRQLGFALQIGGQQLLDFASFADNIGHSGPLTLALAVRWAQSSKKSARLTWARRLEILRPFFKYRLQFDPATEMVPMTFFGHAHRRLVPHIYTDREIAELLEATRNLKLPDGLRPFTLYTLFGLLTVTGMRISEALKLHVQDIDYESGFLTVRTTKFRKSRLVMLHTTTLDALKRYSDARDQWFNGRSAEAFFVSGSGKPIANRTVHWNFEQLRTQLGWVSRGGHKAPRIHDLRHTFICRSLLRSYRHNRPVDKMIDALSTYVGHAKVSDTYWYLTATPELMAIAAKRFARHVEGGAQ